MNKWRKILTVSVCVLSIFPLASCADTTAPTCGTVEQLTDVATQPANVKYPVFEGIVKPAEGVTIVNILHEQLELNLGYPSAAGELKMMFAEGSYKMMGRTSDGKDCVSRFEIK